MKTLNEYTDEELQYGIERCKARLSGIMPKGIMSIPMIKEALKQYKTEQTQRGVIKLF